MKYSRIKDILQQVEEKISYNADGETPIERCPTSPNDKVDFAQLKRLESSLKSVFKKKIGVDFKFPPRHFLDRVNDKRNKQPVNICHVREILLEALNIHADKLSKLKEDEIGVLLKSINTHINIPVSLKPSKGKNRFEFIPLTIMRKPGFKAIEGEARTLKVS